MSRLRRVTVSGDDRTGGTAPRVVLSASLAVFAWLLSACGAGTWRQDPAVQAVRKACKGLDQQARESCVEFHAVGALNPDVCRLAGIWIDDACLQSVYEEAGDPAICERLYLEGVRPNCRAYYDRLNGSVGPAVLFVWNRAGTAEMWTIDPRDGAAQRQHRPEQTIQSPTLSPSGEAVAYIRVTGDYGGVVSELWLMERAGANPRALYVPPAGRSILSRPTWQSDGGGIYMIETGTEAGGALLRVPAGGGEPVRVLADCLDYALSADGQRMVSVSLEQKLLLSDPDNSGIEELGLQGVSVANLGLPVFSPDGSRLAFRATERDRDTWNLYVMEWEGLEVRRLTDLEGFQPASPRSGQVNGISWTGNGGALVYSVDGTQEQSGIWLVDLQGRAPLRLFCAPEGEWVAVQGLWPEPGPMPQ